MVPTNRIMRVIGCVGLFAFVLMLVMIFGKTEGTVEYEQSHWIYWPHMVKRLVWLFLYVKYMLHVSFRNGHSPTVGVIDLILVIAIYFSLANNLPPKLPESPRMIFLHPLAETLALTAFCVMMATQVILVAWDLIVVFRRRFKQA